jgi:hypothetical protein
MVTLLNPDIIQHLGWQTRAEHCENCIPTVKPTRCTSCTNFFIFEYHSTRFGRSFRPSSGVQDCTYSIRYMSYTCCCMYSLELLMMDGKNVQNMKSSIQKRYSFCLMVEASDHGYVLHTRCIYVFSINGG